jgi:hypothetical protein
MFSSMRPVLAERNVRSALRQHGATAKAARQQLAEDSSSGAPGRRAARGRKPTEFSLFDCHPIVEPEAKVALALLEADELGRLRWPEAASNGGNVGEGLGMAATQGVDRTLGGRRREVAFYEIGLGGGAGRSAKGSVVEGRADWNVVRAQTL